MNYLALAFLSTVSFSFGSASVVARDSGPVQTVAAVDLERYQGTWYEIAAIPQRFQAGCVASSADYRLRPDGRVKVINICREADGTTKRVNGVAWAVDETNAKLKVRFFWPFAGDYWIIELADDYSYVVVGHPERETLWILARTPEISSELYSELTDKIRDKHGYDLSQIARTGP